VPTVRVVVLDVLDEHVWVPKTRPMTWVFPL
jgi:hypothetical protein